MPSVHKPRAGSLQFWPRKRAKRIYSRVRSWGKDNDVKLLGFAGYKAGMTHIVYTDNKPHSPTKGEKITTSVTVIECPPLKFFSLRCYKQTSYGLKLVSQINNSKVDKNVQRKVDIVKKVKEQKITRTAIIIIGDVIKPKSYEYSRLYDKSFSHGFRKAKTNSKK